MDSPLEILIPIVFIAIFVIRAIKGVVNQNSQADDREDDWTTSDEWSDIQQPQTQQQAASPAAGTSPPPVTRQHWGEEPQRRTTSGNTNTPNVDIPAVTVRTTTAAQQPSHNKPRKKWANVTPPTRNMGTTEELSAADVGKAMSSGLAPSFPVTSNTKPYGNTAGNQKKLRLKIQGAADLRRAVIFREVLERPRAFDL